LCAAIFLGFTKVEAEIERHALKQAELLEEERAALASKVRLSLQACQDECVRLKEGLAEVKTRVAKYRKDYVAGHPVCM
jgi:hypothetical protein